MLQRYVGVFLDWFMSLVGFLCHSSGRNRYKLPQPKAGILRVKIQGFKHTVDASEIPNNHLGCIIKHNETP